MSFSNGNSPFAGLPLASSQRIFTAAQQSSSAAKPSFPTDSWTQATGARNVHAKLYAGHSKYELQ